MELLAIIGVSIVGTSVLILGSLAIAARFSRRVHRAIFGERTG